MAQATTLSATDYRREPLWHGQIAVIAAIVLQLILPEQYLVAPRSIVLVLEVLLLAALFITTPKDTIFRSIGRKTVAVFLIALISLANIYSLQVVISELLTGGSIANGRELILTSLNIYATNVIIFGLWYWELDGGGPGRRLGRQVHERDFLFPQMRTGAETHRTWRPTFVDYFYLSATNAAAFSPADTMPMSHRAKLLMLTQAVVSLATIALVAARAVGILG